MQNYTEYALERLKEAGFKTTKQRQTVVELLAKSQKALSPYDKKEKLKKQKIDADVVTTYRILETLEKLKLVHKVLALNGYVRCNTDEAGKNICHHYLLCKKCHKVDEIEGEGKALTALENKITTQKGFQIDSHYLEFTGVCREWLEKVK